MIISLVILINKIEKPYEISAPGDFWSVTVYLISSSASTILNNLFSKRIILQYKAHSENQIGFQVIGLSNEIH